MACSPTNFLDLLGRIKNPKTQEDAVGKGIFGTFDSSRYDCIDPLLDALENSTFDNHLKDVAIQKVFEWGAAFRQDNWVGRFLDHPAITPEVYANRLLATARDEKQYTLFPILLKEADLEDLSAVMKNPNYKYVSKDVKTAIKKGLANGQTRRDETSSLL